MSFSLGSISCFYDLDKLNLVVGATVEAGSGMLRLGAADSSYGLGISDGKPANKLGSV